MAGPESDLPGSRRISWFELPAHVRTGIEEILGAHVTAAQSQPGGFSPGSADRVSLSDRRRAFVKAVGTPLNPDSPTLHRSEARILAQLPPDYPAPGLIDTYDDGTWVALACTEVEGRPPAQPWHADELASVLDAVSDLARRGTPSLVRELGTMAEKLDVSLRGWRPLADGEDATGLGPWVAANLERLAQLEERAAAAAQGMTLLHADIRADNLLVTTQGGVVFVDWAWGCLGAPWIDLLMMLPSIRLAGGPPPAEVWASREVGASAPGDRVDAVLAAFSGFLIRQSRRPPPIGLPTVRAFQAAQGAVAIGWLRERLDGAGRPIPPFS